jgi:hypothetical protein
LKLLSNVLKRIANKITGLLPMLENILFLVKSLIHEIIVNFANELENKNQKKVLHKKRGAPPCFGPAAQLPFPLSSLAQPNRAQPISNRFFFLQLEAARWRC